MALLVGVAREAQMSSSQFRILLVHGWAAEPGCWQRLVDLQDQRSGHLSNAQWSSFNLGFFGAADRVGGPVDLVVGHSLGVMWAIQNWEQLQFRGLVALNGFSRFSADPDFRFGTHLRLLKRMRSNLLLGGESLENQLSEFYSRSNGNRPDPYWPLPKSSHEPNSEISKHEGVADLSEVRLVEGLETLMNWDLREQWRRLTKRLKSIEVLAGTSDPIVPPSLTEACFTDVAIHWVSANDHWTPWFEPELCLSLIEKSKRRLLATER